MEAGSVRIARGLWFGFIKPWSSPRHSPAHQPGIFCNEHFGDHDVGPSPEVDPGDGHRYQRGQNPGPANDNNADDATEAQPPVVAALPPGQGTRIDQIA